jgi:HAD superfamily hydrolase (TIGR01509 family)
MSIQALFWDYDNTLLETAQAHWDKHVHVLKTLGINLDEKYRQRIYENNGHQNWQWMHQELGLHMKDSQYLAAVDETFRKNLSELKLRPGVLEILDLLKTRNIPQAIITNARKASALPVIEAKGLLVQMQFILFKDDYEGRKPSPTPYLKGLEKMESLLQTKLEPQKCLAIEDDPKGVEAAYRAGLTVIQRTVSKEDLPSPLAHYVCFEQEAFIARVKELLTS